MIFKAVGDTRPYPDHGYATTRQWAKVPPRQVRLDELVTTKSTLDLTQLLAEDSTFYGDLFAHVVQWNDTLYLEDGLHRAVRAALAQRTLLHARVLVMEAAPASGGSAGGSAGKDAGRATGKDAGKDDDGPPGDRAGKS